VRVKIQLLHFQGCPNVDAARAAVREAILAEKVDVAVEEIDVEAPAAPTWTRGWGSPTILVDGQDVAGQQPSESSACRLYAGGAPAVETIRASIAMARGAGPGKARVALPMIGAVTAAIAASACCLVPAVLAIVGVSGAGFASRFAPYRPYFLIATGIALAAGFWFAYRPQKDACGCGVPRSRKAARVGLWLTMLLTIGLTAYPLLGSGNVTVGSESAEAKAELHLKVKGMDCKECTSTIANRLKKVPGVVSATVDFESGNAIVRYDGREGMASATIKAVQDAGFDAEAQP
jgi:mercuric ion transport protein